MKKTRLSKLQKIILTTLYEKDKADEKSECKPPWVKNPPYWHATRDSYVGVAEGKVIPILIEMGVTNHVKKAGCFKDATFLPSFSRSIRNLHLKGLIERPQYVNDNNRFDSLKLTEKALLLISNFQYLTLRQVSQK